MQRKMILVAAALALSMAAAAALSAKKAKAVPPSAHISDDDVIAFADNFAAISDELKSYSGVREDMSLEDAEKVIGKDEMESLLARHGISAPERRKKLDMMVLCYSKLLIEEKLKDEPAFMASSIRKQVEKEFRNRINPDDEQVVSRHGDYLEKKLSAYFEEE